jgi:hypothetical protein
VFLFEVQGSQLASVCKVRSTPTTIMPPTHRTPLRRTSHNSLFGLSRSTQLPESASSLDFIESTMEEFVEEASRLRANYEGITQLDETLHTFNDAFASWLYVMDMNALTTDWPQVGTHKIAHELVLNNLKGPDRYLLKLAQQRAGVFVFSTKKGGLHHR